MTTWNPGDVGPDLLSSGDDEPPAAARFRTAAVAVVCLLAGAFIGTRIDDAGSPLSDLVDPPPAALTGGVVTPVADTDRPQPHRFQVGVFNPGERAVRVMVVGLAGWSTTVVADATAAVAPNSWAQARFSLPDVCEEPTLPVATAIRIRVVAPETAGEQQVELATPADAVKDDQDLECPRSSSLREGQLTGLWYLEEARGRWAEFAGTSLMRFSHDGRFAFDPEGRMFVEEDQGVVGTYGLDGSRLRLRADGGYACEVGHTDVWTTTLVSEDRLRLDIVRSDGGYCHSPPGERRILRRLATEGGLLPGVTSPATVER